MGLLKASTGSQSDSRPFCPIPSRHTPHRGSQGGGRDMSAKQRESRVGVGWETHWQREMKAVLRRGNEGKSRNQTSDQENESVQRK